uniref:Solute carrier family 2 member 13b n=1 Tax=Neogobius melanostomus TaxID=47308 RepID=A0A8C6T615_9GOBI
MLCFFSALGGFLFGYDTGVVSGAMLLLKREWNLSSLWQELLVSSTVGAAAVAALCGGSMNGTLGRRRCILLASFIFSIGGFVLGFAPNKEVLLVGRITVGLGIGLASMTVPVYIAEVSPPLHRGQLVTINALFITGGQFVASVVDGLFSYASDGWRWMLGLSAAPALLQFVGFLFLPESPRWLVLRRIRGGQDVEEEHQAIQDSIEEEQREEGSGGVVLFRILRHAPTRRALIVGCGLQMFQQLSGINTVILLVLAVGFLLSAQNSPPITVPDRDNSSVCSSYSLCERCMLDPSCGFCYRENRSSVLDSSCVAVALESTDRADHGRYNAGPGLVWAYNFCPSSSSWVVLLGLVLYLASFAPGMGPMPWTVNSEIYPLWARSTGNACSSGVNWAFNVLVSLTFLHVAQYLTYYGAFFLYAALVAVALVFVVTSLPETRRLRLEDMEVLFSRPLCSASSAPPHADVQYTPVNGRDRSGSESETDLE